jgi:CHAT domain-containing protein
MEGGTPGRFLVQRYDVGYVSSAAVWLELLKRAGIAKGGDRVLAMAPRTSELPGARSEVAAISQLYGSSALVLSGSQATVRAFMDAAPGRSIIHLATLGSLNKHNPLFSYVDLAPSGNIDGRLEVHDVAALRLPARLVVLSACQTALGGGRMIDVPPGDDWVGLVQAFQTAGAQAVLATLWPVDDRETATFMTRFYSTLRSGKSEIAALAAAQRIAIGASASRSPYYWAGFTLDGGL